MINLGAGWGWATFGEDTDFLASTQARVGAELHAVLRAQWAGVVLGETKTFGFNDEATGFWNGVALYHQRKIIEEFKAVALAAVGTDIGEANESKEKDVAETVTLSEADRKIVVS